MREIFRWNLTLHLHFLVLLPLSFFLYHSIRFVAPFTVRVEFFKSALASYHQRTDFTRKYALSLANASLLTLPKQALLIPSLSYKSIFLLSVLLRLHPHSSIFISWYSFRSPICTCSYEAVHSNMLSAIQRVNPQDDIDRFSREHGAGMPYILPVRIEIYIYIYIYMEITFAQRSKYIHTHTHTNMNIYIYIYMNMYIIHTDFTLAQHWNVIMPADWDWRVPSDVWHFRDKGKRGVGWLRWSLGTRQWT